MFSYIHYILHIQIIISYYFVFGNMDGETNPFSCNNHGNFESTREVTLTKKLRFLESLLPSL